LARVVVSLPSILTIASFCMFPLFPYKQKPGIVSMIALKKGEVGVSEDRCVVLTYPNLQLLRRCKAWYNSQRIFS